MRDIFVTLIVMGTIPFILRRPWIGILVWAWLGFMNPHRISWGFATTMPFAQIIAIVTVISMLFYNGKKSLQVTAEVKALILLLVWFFITTLFARYQALAWEQLIKVYKIQFMTLVTLMLIRDRFQLNWLIGAIVFSFAFYGVKGGIFTILTGGTHRVWGPPGTFIGGNNEIGLALLMALPLMRYIQLQATNFWAKHAMTVVMALTFFAILGTHSRGALVGIAAMSIIFLWRSPNKIGVLLIASLVLPLGYKFMPQHWHDRMATIENYQEDGSAMNRIYSWEFAIGVAKESPLHGGGFEVFAGRKDAHSIYFEILGEHGFVGFGLFLTLGVLCFVALHRLRKRAREDESTKWIADLASMVQVSLVSFASAGAFLGLAYFDLYYTLVATIAIMKVQLDAALLKKDTKGVGDPSRGRIQATAKRQLSG